MTTTEILKRLDIEIYTARHDDVAHIEPILLVQSRRAIADLVDLRKSMAGLRLAYDRWLIVKDSIRDDYRDGVRDDDADSAVDNVLAAVTDLLAWEEK